MHYYDRYWQGKLPKDVKFFIDHPKWDECKIRQYEAWVNKWVGDVKILDYGCGEGDFTARVNAIGTDISETVLNAARRKHKDTLFRSLENLKGDKFGAVLLFDVMEHIFDFDEIFATLSPVLADKARLLIATNEMCAAKMFFIGTFFMQEFFHPYSPHIRFFTRKTLAQLLALHGFKVIHQERTGNYFGLISQGQFVVAEKI